MTISLPRRRRRRAPILLLAALLLAGCGSGSGPSGGSSTAGTASGGASGSASVTATGGSSAAPSSPTSSPSSVNRWTALPRSPLPRLQVPVGVWDGSELLIAGEVSGQGSEAPAGHAAAYNPVTRTWRILPPPSGRRVAVQGTPTAVWTGREMIVWGGDFHEAFAPVRNTWRTLPSPDGVPYGGGFAAVWTGRVLVLYGGGCCGGPDARAASYDPRTDRWTILSAALLGARWTSGAWTGTEVVVAGGVGPPASGPDAPNRDLATAGAFNPATGRWRALPPMPRGGYGTAVWDGQHVLVIGERVAASYSPATNSWTTLPAGFDHRFESGVVWAGDRLLAWGGLVHASRAGTSEAVSPSHGLAYVPAARRWVNLPMSPLRGRSDPVTAWTGGQLLVWGGQGEQDGAAYTP